MNSKIKKIRVLVIEFIAVFGVNSRFATSHRFLEPKRQVNMKLPNTN